MCKYNTYILKLYLYSRLLLYYYVLHFIDIAFIRENQCSLYYLLILSIIVFHHFLESFWEFHNILINSSIDTYTNTINGQFTFASETFGALNIKYVFGNEKKKQKYLNTKNNTNNKGIQYIPFWVRNIRNNIVYVFLK